MPTEKEQILKIQSALQAGDKLSQLRAIFKDDAPSGSDTGSGVPGNACFRTYENCVTSGPFSVARNLECALDLIGCIRDVALDATNPGGKGLTATEGLLAAALVELNRNRQARPSDNSTREDN